MDPISTRPASQEQCEHVRRGSYVSEPLGPGEFIEQALDPRRAPPTLGEFVEPGRDPLADPLPTPLGTAMRIGEPCWFRSGDTMPWMPGIFEGVDDETGDAIVLALESNLKTKRYRFGPRIRPVRTAAAPPLVPQAEAEARLVALRESFEPLRQTAANLVRHAERKGERFTTARTVDVEAVREALAGLGFA